MAASPLWKVYIGLEYRAACKGVEEAAVLVDFLGKGATIRCDHSLVVWHEGHEDQAAAESWDHVVEVVHARLDAHRAAVTAKRAAREKGLHVEACPHCLGMRGAGPCPVHEKGAA
jgi:hypothetical protein